MRFKKQGFSLVEVVLALGIVAFAGLTLVGLFSLGLNVNRESVEELEATHVAQSLFAARRTAPAADLGASFPLPSFEVAAELGTETPRYLNAEGGLETDRARAKFGLVYRITPRPAPQQATDVYICLFWPAQGDSDKALGTYESFSIFSLR